jgi:alpha-methylacyl-CoA racemase
MREMLAEKFATKTRDEWTKIFDDVDACVAPVLWLSEAASHPHLVARSTLVDVNGVTHPNAAPRFSRTPGKIGTPPRPPGADTVAALSDWGIDTTRIGKLQADGAVVQVEVQG